MLSEDAAPLVIRNAERHEFATLAALQIRSWRDVYRGVFPDTYLDHEIEADLGARWETLRPNGDDLVLVADRQGVRGFITVWCQPDPYIDNLHVEPGERSGGIGYSLMQAAATRLLDGGYKSVSLNVAAQNLRAVAFYRRLGGRFGPARLLHQENGGNVEAIEVVWDDLTQFADSD